MSVKIIDNYPEFLNEYIEIFEPIFKKAYEVSEFNLILSLLAIRGSSDTGWQPYENTLEVFEEIYKQNNKFKRNLKVNINLWLYTHLIESSEQYELIANMIKTVKGEDYIIANYVNVDFVNLKVNQKIDRLKSIALGTDFENAYEPFEKTFNNRLRNAVGHADYAIKKGSGGGVTIIDNSGSPLLLPTQEINDYINRAIALHVSIRTLRDTYIHHFDKPIEIDSSATFGNGNSIKVQLIVRKGHGVVGFRCMGGHDDGKPFESRMTSCYPYELRLIKKGFNELPRSRIKKANKILSTLPSPVARKLRPHIEKFVNR